MNAIKMLLKNYNVELRVKYLSNKEKFRVSCAINNQEIVAAFSPQLEYALFKAIRLFLEMQGEDGRIINQMVELLKVECNIPLDKQILND